MAPQMTLPDVTFTAIDIETTGLTPVVGRIIEIGAVRFRGDEMIGIFEAFVDPGVPISAQPSPPTRILILSATCCRLFVCPCIS